MPTTRPRRVLLPLLLLACWLGTAGTAQAHTALSSSSPAEGSTVTEALTAAVLDFSGAVRGAEVTVTGPDGTVVSTGPASTDGGTVTVPVSPTATGSHTIAWSVTSADGHDLEGTTGFGYAGPVAAPTTASAAPTSAAPTSAGATSAAVTSVSTAADESVMATEPVASTGGRTGTVVVVLLVALVVLGVVTAGLRRRR